MSKLRKKLITVLAVLFCALLTISTALMIPKNKTADAYINSPETVDVKELYNSTTNGFSAKNLTTLYGKLYSGATKYDTVATSLSHETNKELALGDREIIVEFAGMKWLAVYLSQAKHSLTGIVENKTVGETDDEKALKGYADDEDVVLTLWLASSTQTAQWQNIDNINDDICYDKNGTSVGGKYPVNMYGTSYMRTYVLNNGGNYLQSVNSVANVATQNSTNDFAHFTMSNPDNGHASVVDYLVAPRYMQWQYQQNSQNVGTTNAIVNDAWGKLGSSYFLARYYEEYQTLKGWDKDYYTIWKDDLVWLPANCEVGFGSTSANLPNGMWHTTLAERQTQNGFWLRSGSPVDTTQTGTAQTDDGHTKCIFTIGSDGMMDGQTDRIAANQTRLVRPAIHLNLSKADGTVKSVSYDNVDLENVDAGSTEVANDETAHIFKHVYDGETNTVSVTLGDMDNLVQEGTTPTGATFVDGVFKATYPDDHDDKTYTITVKPNTGYSWYDNDGVEARTYSITVEATPIKVDWNSAITGNLNGTLLQEKTKVTSEKFTSGVNFTQKFYKIEPDVSDKSLPSNPTWTTRDDLSNYFKASQAGLYYMYYQIEAQYHKTTTVTNYTVNVSSDTIHFNLSDDIEIKQTFGTEKAADLRSNLKEQIEDWVSDGLMTVKGQPSNKVYQDTDLTNLLTNLEVVLLDGDMTEASPFEGHSYYNVGTYNLHIRYKDSVSAENRTLGFEWDDGKRPTLKIEKKRIAVDIVVANEGDSLEHVYGSFNKDLLAYKIPDGVIPNGETEDDLKIRKGVFRIVNDDETLGDELNDSTPAGTYRIKGVAQNSNYDVQFEPVTYKVTKLKITLQVADETVGYGTDFSNHKYNDLIRTGTDLVNGDTLSQVITSKNYYLLINDSEIELSSDLAIGQYTLCARITSDNYEFEVTAGKLTITKANFDLSGVKLKNEGYIYDGEPHPAKLNGDLPEGVTESFRYVNYETGEELDSAPVEVGLYLVYASFSHNSTNHNPITEVKAAYIRIAYSPDALNEPYPPLPTDEQLAEAADLAKKKAEAKEELEKEAQAKKEEIDNDLNLSAEEKAAAKSEVDKELADGKAEIDKAKNKDGVDSALSDGKKEIDDTADLAQGKGAAKSELDKAAQAKKDAIDNDPNLTEEEKAAAKAEVDKELADGKDAIDGATDLSSIDSAESSTKANIENIKPEHKGDFPWWILAVIAGAIVLVTVLIIVIVKRRNSDDDDGYDDFYDDEYDYDEEEEIDDDGDEAFDF